MKEKEIHKEICEINRRIIRALRKGIGPWNRYWGLPGGVHRNAFTGKPYRGVNAIVLNLTAMSRRFTSNLWLTYKEAKRLGGYVCPREKGVRVIGRVVPFETCVVFNLEQTKRVRLPQKVKKVTQNKNKEILRKLFSLPQIRWGSKALYDPVEDRIELPLPKTFGSVEDFWFVFLHELIHWSGSSNRLNREVNSYAEYVMEELVAEMGAGFLASYIGISKTRQIRHPEYIGEWIRVLEKDKTGRLILTAAHRAQEACDWLLSQASSQK